MLIAQKDELSLCVELHMVHILSAKQTFIGKDMLYIVTIFVGIKK